MTDQHREHRSDIGMLVNVPGIYDTRLAEVAGSVGLAWRQTLVWLSS